MLSHFLKGRPARFGPGKRPLDWILLLGFLMGLGGCGGCSSGTSVTSSGGSSAPATLARDLLNPAMAMMQPEKLGIEANPGQPAGLLNQWRAIQEKNAGDDPPVESLPEEARSLLESELSAEAVERAERKEFNVEDVRHIRTSILMKNIVDHVARGVDGELNRARVVFEFVGRNIELVSEDEALPLMPYEMLIFGEGTAADRAWIFAELLRQLNQDAVIVRSGAGDEAGDAPWFVGAVANGKIYLFDPLRSTPVPTAIRANTEQIPPAALAELSHPKTLENLSAGADDPLTPQAFENIRLEVIGTPMLWAPRHAYLQKALTGSQSVAISQALVTEEGESASIIDRIASLEGTPEEIHLWSHPENRIRGFEELDSLSERWKPFNAPQNRAVDPRTGQVVFGNYSERQLRTRTQQLKGQYEDAIRGYLQVKLAYTKLPGGVPGEIRELHADAAEDAEFWASVCQMEQGVFSGAATKLQKYVRESERFTGSRHPDHARILLARCLIQLGKPAEAVEVLSRLKPDSPAYATAQFQIYALENAEGSAQPPGGPMPTPSESSQTSQEEPEPHRPAVAERLKG